MRLDVIFSERVEKINVKFVSDAKFTCGFKNLQVVKEHSEEIYEGPLVVDPRFSDQILTTKGKLMPGDVTVHEIFVSEVSNPAGGKTVFIGV